MPQKRRRRTKDASALSSSAPIKLAVKATTKLQIIAHDDEEMHDFEATIGQKSDDKEWNEAKQAQK